MAEHTEIKNEATEATAGPAQTDEKTVEDQKPQETKETNDGFKAITSQSELDSIIGERVKRAQRAERAKFDGFMTPTEYKDLKQENEDLKYQLKEIQTLQLKKEIAKEFGLPDDLANRLTGDDEKELRKDAKALASYFSPRSPRKNNEHLSGSSDDLELLRAVRGH